MAMPSVQELLLPVVGMMRDGLAHSSETLLDGVNSDPKLTDEDKQRRHVKSGQNILQNRASSALVHLVMGRATTRKMESVYEIAERGIAILNEHPEPLTIRYLHPPAPYLDL